MVELKSSKLILNKRFFGFSELEMKNGMSKAATKLGFVADGAPDPEVAHGSEVQKEDANNASYVITKDGGWSKEDLQTLYQKIEWLDDPSYKSKEKEFLEHQNRMVAKFYSQYGLYLTQEQTLELAKEINAYAFPETRIRLSTVYQSNTMIGKDWKENFDFSRDENGRVIAKTPNGKFTCTVSSKWVYISNDWTAKQCKDGTLFDMVVNVNLEETAATVSRFSSSIELGPDGRYKLRLNTPRS